MAPFRALRTSCHGGFNTKTWRPGEWHSSPSPPSHLHMVTPGSKNTGWVWGNCQTQSSTAVASHLHWALNPSDFITKIVLQAPSLSLPSPDPQRCNSHINGLFKVSNRMRLFILQLVFYTFFVVIVLYLSLLFLFTGHYWAEEAEPCWIQALPLWEQWPTPSDSHEHLQVQWRSWETTSGQPGVLVAPQPRRAWLGDAALADAAQLWLRGGGVKGQRRRRPQQGVQRELGQGGQRARRRQGAAEEEQGHWLQARPQKSTVWEAEAAQRLRTHLRDVWDCCHGDRDRAVMGGLH